jgi:acyl carrier protein
MSESIQERVLKVISKSQRMPIEKITPDSTFEELGIDSMDAINILFDLESEFEIEIDDEKAKQLCKVSEMIEGVTLLVRAKEAAAPPQS